KIFGHARALRGTGKTQVAVVDARAARLVEEYLSAHAAQVLVALGVFEFDVVLHPFGLPALFLKGEVAGAEGDLGAIAELLEKVLGREAEIADPGMLKLGG